MNRTGDNRTILLFFPMGRALPAWFGASPREVKRIAESDNRIRRGIRQ